MKIDELRKAIVHHSSDDLRLLVVELYKRLPRVKAAEEDLGQILQNPSLLRQPKAARPKKEPVIDMAGLSSEVASFVTDARAGNYYGPNRVISKAERKRWRFDAMRFRKELLASARHEENLPAAGELLEMLFRVLCDSCSGYLFQSEDPFAAVGVTQPQYLGEVIQLRKGVHAPRQLVESVVSLTVDVPLSRTSLRSHLIAAVVPFLDTTDLREMTLEQLDRMREQFLQSPETRRAMAKSYGDYAVEERLETMAELGFACCMALREPERAVTYYRTHERKPDREIGLYCLLRLLQSSSLDHEWIREYESALDQGISPREGLRQEYATRKEKLRK